MLLSKGLRGLCVTAAIILLQTCRLEGAEKAKYQVVGAILQADGTPFPGANPIVYLHGAITPFGRETVAGHDGKFKFKDVPTGTYVLIGTVPRAGELRKTIEVGPSFADSKRTVLVTLTFDNPASVDRGARVSTAELSVSQDAIQEYRSAQEFVSRGNVKAAVERLKKAVEISPQYAAAWNQLGTISYQTAQYRQAETYFREALKQDPEAYSPLVNLGGALLALNRFEEALEINRAAVRVMPGDALANSQLGKSYFYLGKMDEAETYFRRAKSLDPSHFSYPQVYLIEIYARKNQLTAAISEMEEFLKLHPDSDWAPRIRETLGTARERLKAQTAVP